MHGDENGHGRPLFLRRGLKTWRSEPLRYLRRSNGLSCLPQKALALDTRGDELCFRSQPSSLCFETIFQSFGLLKAIALNHGASPLLIRRERNLAFSSPIKAKIPRGDNEDYFSKDGGDTTNVSWNSERLHKELH